MTSTSSLPSPSLAALAAEYWDKRLEADPIEATLLGDRRFDDRMPDPSPDADRHEIERLRRLGARVRAVDVAGASDADRITHAALLGEIDNDLALRACALGDWAVDPRDGPQVLLLNLSHLQTVATPEQGSALVASRNTTTHETTPTGRAANTKASPSTTPTDQHVAMI